MGDNNNINIDNDLNLPDLYELKKSVDEMSDEDIYNLISRPLDQFEFSQSDVTRLQERINNDIHKDQRKKHMRRLGIACAAVFLPVMIIGASYLLFTNQDTTLIDNPFYAKEMSIMTNNGERSVTTLPDGSEIKLGPGSSLTYSMSSFNDHMRHINYTGDGYFDIARRDDVPFTINVNKFEIKVLGTSFSVKSREHKEYSEIYLRDGAIQLMSYITRQQHDMKPGELAIINNATGEIDIQPVSERNAMTQSVLIFKSTELQAIADELKIYYDIDLIIGNEDMASRKFTGSIPTDNLDQAIYILGTAMQIQIEEVTPASYRLM
ncbi:MAG: FecR domain-containing protein [Muribaculaceae bacterium]|nr:FecR domain-containing protein [Muribaculaceae bacterium]